MKEKKSPIKEALKRFGYAKHNPREGLEDIFVDIEFMRIYETVLMYTMTSPQRLYSLYKSVEYIIQNNIPGDFVECGVWRGGSSMTIALTLKKMNVSDRKIYMYDTYEGMSEPSENDSDIYGNKADTMLNTVQKIDKEENIWCYASLGDVKQNIFSTGYPENNIVFVKGKVEDTIPGIIPSSIAILRLDTDWYESTLHELNHLYPLLVSRGVLIIDDYGHWEGARKAVDEYIQQNKLSLLLNRIDYTARTAVKY
jgi:O-methyltransferase